MSLGNGDLRSRTLVLGRNDGRPEGMPSSAEPKFSYYLSVNWRPKQYSIGVAIDDDF